MMDYVSLHSACLLPLRIMACVVADGDRDLRDDLEQEGRIVVWKLAPRCEAPKMPRWLRRAVWYRMLGFVRWLHANGGMCGRTRTRYHAMDISWPTDV